MKQVVAERNDVVVTLDELSTNKGYVMLGNKGEFIIARDTDGKYIWVRLNPTKTTAKPVKAFDTLKGAIEDKLNHGYDVFEYTSITVE